MFVSVVFVLYFNSLVISSVATKCSVAKSKCEINITINHVLYGYPFGTCTIKTMIFGLPRLIDNPIHKTNGVKEIFTINLQLFVFCRLLGISR